MDSRRWLVGLGALALALAAALAVDLLRGTGPQPGGRVVPELAPREVRALRIERTGEPAIELERAGDEEGAWRLRAPLEAPADPAAVQEVIGAIELLAARRREPGRVGAAALRVRVEAGGEPVELAFAPPSGATDRIWVSSSAGEGRALVDGYLVRQIAVEVDQLRERRPLRGVAGGARRIRLAAGERSIELTGPPWRLGAVRADPAAVDRLLLRLSQLRVERFAPPDTAVEPALEVTVEGEGGGDGGGEGSDPVAIALGGPCTVGPGVLARTPAGVGCVAEEERAALARLVEEPASLYDRGLVAVPIDEVTGLRLRAGGQAVEASRDEAAAPLRAWLRSVQAAITGEVVPADSLVEIGAIEIDAGEAGQETIVIARPRGRHDRRLALRRAGEPVGFLLDAGATALLEPSPHLFRSLDLIELDPSALAAAAARRGGRVIEAVERGEVLEEWSARAPAGAAVDDDAVNALLEQVAYLRAERVVAARARPPHGLAPPRRTVELRFDPAPGADRPIVHVIDLGAATAAGGCHARMGDDPVVYELPAARCRALAGPWTAPAGSPR